MAKVNKKWLYIPVALLFVLYIFIVPRPIPEETILALRWITSLESNYPVGAENFSGNADEELLPFILGEHFGYMTAGDGKFTVNRTKAGYISISENYWAEYPPLPSSVHIMNPLGEAFLTVENRGYPLFLDGRIFMVGSEQNSITALDPAGEELWTYDFPAPVTCVDAAGGYVLAGTLDGVLILLNSSGVPAFAPFEPGGSRLSVIAGCAISRDASRLAVISGIGNQRFLLLENAGDTYKVVQHEFLTEGFRRPVHINFIDNDSKVVFEREGGLGIYNINSRASTRLDLEGEIVFLDPSGEDEFLFVVTSQGSEEKRFITIRSPGIVVNNAPFKSGSAFFTRRDRRLYIGGDATMASFELEKSN